MGLFDRFTSSKGQERQAAPKRGVVKADPKAESSKRQAFQNVPAAEETPKDKKPEVSKTPVAAKPVKMSINSGRTLIRGVITEKSSRLAKLSQYVFEVAPAANKTAVAEAVQATYGVKPVAVNILKRKGKVVRYGRFYGRQMGIKHAVVTLPAGKSIDVAGA